MFKKWLAQVENESGRKLKCLKSDNGDDYCDGGFEEFCVSQGIRRVKMVSTNPHHNRVTECMNRTIRSMLAEYEYMLDCPSSSRQIQSTRWYI